MSLLANLGFSPGPPGALVGADFGNGLTVQMISIVGNVGVTVTPNPIRSELVIQSLQARQFTSQGTPTVSTATPPVYFDRPFVCAGIAAACGTTPSGGPATLTLQLSPDGVNWSTLASVSIVAGSYSGTVSCTTAIPAGTFVRGFWTAVNGVANATAVLYLLG